MNKFIGLRDFDNEGGANNPQRFSYLDPNLTGLEAFFAVTGEGPWGNNQPDDNGNENCVEYVFERLPPPDK